MAALLKIVDEHLGKGRNAPFELRLASERITARDLIHRRIAEETRQINQLLNDDPTCDGRSYLIRHTPTEAALNTAGTTQGRRPVKRFDEAQEFDAAITAFEKNRFIMLFDDRQITDLDMEIAVTPSSEVVFLRLVPLVGG